MNIDSLTGLAQLKRDKANDGYIPNPSTSSLIPPSGPIHPGTRVTILETINAWSLPSPEYTHVPILWITGEEGTGKTTLAKRVCADFINDRRMLANFFMSHSNIRWWYTNSIRYVVSTLAYQIWESIPPTRQYIEEAMERNPDMVKESRKEQVEKLLLEPLRACIASGGLMNYHPRVFILDQLEQAQDMSDSGLELLESLADLVEKLETPTGQPGFRILLFTRSLPECIHQTHPVFLSKTAYISLSSPPISLADIRIFYASKFATALFQHPFVLQLAADPVDGTWPHKEVLGKLVELTEGRFDIAERVVRFVQPFRFHPDERLGILMKPENGLDLEVLKKYINLYTA